jgi:hypothetical protein
VNFYILGVVILILVIGIIASVVVNRRRGEAPLL